MCGTEQTVYLSVPMVIIFMFILKDFIGKPKNENLREKSAHGSKSAWDLGFSQMGLGQITHSNTTK